MLLAKDLAKDLPQNKTLFRPIWLWYSRYLSFLIVIINMIHAFISFYIVVSKCEEWKEEAFYGRPRAKVSIVTPLQ